MRWALGVEYPDSHTGGRRDPGHHYAPDVRRPDGRVVRRPVGAGLVPPGGAVQRAGRAGCRCGRGDGGGILGGFFTLWTYANTRAEGKDRYGTLFEFNPTTVTPSSPSSTRSAGTGPGRRRTVPFKRTGGRTAPFAETADPTEAFRLTTARTT